MSCSCVADMSLSVAMGVAEMRGGVGRCGWAGARVPQSRADRNTSGAIARRIRWTGRLRLDMYVSLSEQEGWRRPLPIQRSGRGFG